MFRKLGSATRRMIAGEWPSAQKLIVDVLRVSFKPLNLARPNRMMIRVSKKIRLYLGLRPSARGQAGQGGERPRLGKLGAERCGQAGCLRLYWVRLYWGLGPSARGQAGQGPERCGQAGQRAERCGQAGCPYHTPVSSFITSGGGGIVSYILGSRIIPYFHMQAPSPTLLRYPRTQAYNLTQPLIQANNAIETKD